MGGEGKTSARVPVEFPIARTSKDDERIKRHGNRWQKFKVEFAKQSRLIGTTTNVVIKYGTSATVGFGQGRTKRKRKRERKKDAQENK